MQVVTPKKDNIQMKAVLILAQEDAILLQIYNLIKEHSDAILEKQYKTPLNLQQKLLYRIRR